MNKYQQKTKDRYRHKYKIRTEGVEQMDRPAPFRDRCNESTKHDDEGVSVHRHEEEGRTEILSF